jgi:putative ABC transport system permease protein
MFMIANYFRTASRFFLKNISFTFINIIGLTTGMTGFLLIAMFLQHELGFDKHLPKPDHTFRMVGIQEPRGLEKQHVAFTSGGWADYIRHHIPEVQSAFRLMRAPAIAFEVGEERFRETRVFYADGESCFYLGLPLIHGTLEGAVLDEPNQALLSKTTAELFFGTDDVLGLTIRDGSQVYSIIGVYDNENIRSHLEVNVFLSLATIEPGWANMHDLRNNSLATYMVLSDPSNKVYVEQILNDHYEEYLNESGHTHWMPITFYLQQARDIYLRSGHLKFSVYSRMGSVNTIYTFSLIALLIILIACINYVNLSTANALKRAREVGMRKVLGADRTSLALQYMGESVLIAFIALFFSLALVELLLPTFNTLLNTGLKIDLAGNPLFNIGLLLLFLFVGMVSGFYPALYLSRFQAIEIFRPLRVSGKSRTVWVRKMLVVLQFTVSTALIMSTLVIMNQVSFMKAKDRGYKPENTITFFLGQDIPYERAIDFRNHLMTFPEIKNIGLASNYNGVAGNQSDIESADSISGRQMVRFGFVDPDYFPTMGMEMLTGRNFSHEYRTDAYQTAVINEATMRAFGWDNPVGKRFVNTWFDDHDYFTVIGVVRDYHYYSLHSQIEPAVYLFLPDQVPAMNIRYEGNDPAMLVRRIEEAFEQYFPRHFFVPHFVDQVLERETRTEENTMKIFTWFSVLCIVISCLGLFGLTAYMVTQRKREISIRKVLGGSVFRINVMLLSGFLKWVLLAALIAFPLTYLGLERWLGNYPYRIHIGPEHIVIPLLLILLIASAAVLILSTRAANQPPAENLSCE